MGWQRLREAVPTVVMHMAAAAVHLMAAAGVGGQFGPPFLSLVGAVLLVLPTLAVLAFLGGSPRLGSLCLAGSFAAAAGLVLYSHLGLGLLHASLLAPSSPWKVLFLVTAALLPLLQITGILEATRSLVAAGEGQPRLVEK